MASTSNAVAGLPLEKLALYHAADPILSSVFVFYGPVVTANSTVSSSRIQAHIFTAGGLQSYSRITISPAAPLYAAVNHLPRDKQGDEVYRALAVSLLKYFEELSDPVKIGLLSISRGGKQGSRLPRTFDEMHAADLANKMLRVDATSEIVRGLKDSFGERLVPWIDVDFVLPAGTITTSRAARDSVGESITGEDFIRQYGRYSSLISKLGEPIFLPTSKLRRAPSKPTNSSKSRLFSAEQKEALRLAMCELVDTEERYVGKMYDLVHNVMSEFQQKAAGKSDTSTSPDEASLALLFPPCLSEILNVNIEFLDVIRGILEQTEQEALADMSGDTDIDSTSFRRDSSGKRKDPLGITSFARSLVDWFPRFSKPYGDYMHAHHGFSQTLNGFLTNQQSSFSKRVHETGEQKMRSLLMEPVQRLPRYSLLIDTMTGALPSVHPAVKSLLKARDVITEICSLDSHSFQDSVRSSERLRELVTGLSSSDLPSGRLIAAADFLDVTHPSRMASPEIAPASGILLVYSDILLSLSKTPGSKLTARGLYADLDKPSISDSGDQTLPQELICSQTWQISTIRCTQSACGRVLYITPADSFVQSERSDSRGTTRAIELASNYEGKASRLIEEITKAKIEDRFPEQYRECGKWTLHSLRDTGKNLGILLSVYEEEPNHVGVPKTPSHVKLVVGGTKAARLKELNRSGVEVIASVSAAGGEKYKLDMDSVLAISSTEIFTASDFVTTITSKMNHLLRPLNQPQNPILTNVIINSNFNILRAVASQILGHTKISRGFRPPSPTKLLSNLWNSGNGKDTLTPSKSSSSIAGLGNVPVMRPPTFEPSRAINSTPNPAGKQSNQTQQTLVGVNSEKPQDALEVLEQTFTTYILAIRSRSGNIVGRVLRSRNQAGEAAINELYNILLENPNHIQAAAEAPIDVLFVAFETFMARAWKERIGPLISAQALETMQAKFDTMFPGDFEDYFRHFLTEISPQAHRALTALVKLLAELLDASGNDGDRGALTATFCEILTENGDPMTHISLLDRLVEDFDRLFSDDLSVTAPLEGNLIHDQLGLLGRTNSVNASSMTSNTSSFRRRFGFGSNKDSGKVEGEGKVSSIIRTLSKSKGSGEAQSPAHSLSKGSLFRSRSTDTDSRLVSLLRPVSRDRLHVHGLFSAEDQQARPNSSHSNAPTLSSIGEDHAVPHSAPPKKKRRSSLSDLKPMSSTPGITPLQSPIDTRKFLHPPSTPDAKPPEGESSPTRQAKAASSIPRQIPKQPASPTRFGSPVRNATTATTRKENVPPSARNTLPERPSQKTAGVTNPRSSPKRRTQHQPHVQPLKAGAGLKERATLPNASEPHGSRTQPTSSPQKTQKLRMQNPQKLRERLRSEKTALASAESSLQAELSSIGHEISGSKPSPTKPRPLSSGPTQKSVTSPSSVPSPVTAANHRVRPLESKVSTMASDFGSRIATLEKDVESSLIVSEKRVKELDELYRQASAENEALYERFNTELSKVTKDVKLGSGGDALRSQLKEALEEIARVKKENLRLKREIGGLRAQHAGATPGAALNHESENQQ